MGLDLTLLPHFYGDEEEMLINGKFGILTYARIPFHRDGVLFDYFDKIPQKELPKDSTVLFYDDEGLKKIKTDPYGKKIKYVLSNQLKDIKVSKLNGNWNKSMIEALKKLKNVPILLYWH